MSKISNEEVSVPTGITLNDKDELSILLTFIKNLEKNMTVALTEASNEKLYNIYKKMFDDISEIDRNIYELMFKFGWYSIESSNQEKINTLLKDLTKQLEDLTN